MANQLELTVLPKPSEDPDACRDTALFVLREFTIDDDPSSEYLEIMMDAMEDRTTVAAINTDGRILSTAGLKTGKDSIGTIVDVATCSTTRGQGLGRDVIGLLEAIAEEQGLEMLTVHPLSSAVGFYEKLGYEEYDDEYVKVIS